MTSTKPPNCEFVARPATPEGGPVAAASQNQAGSHPQPAAQGQLPTASSLSADTNRATSAAKSTATVPDPRSQDLKAAAPAATPSIMTSAADERAVILKRIAAFRNLQTKLRQDREKYYDQTLARTRSLLSQPIKPRR
ncbi:hypothetical protein SR870_23805 [Rhodopseudomonas palustris]|uniref:hypothetical protein n=1 Tax=Rhodopseudomonas palustris TaxID=1076 RepID=UPI002ACE462F|nr:hypothetical protein [Rhodopseudomonas palustris]WQG99654.1 hypothetical protein SR870_23805 [Rhodopseudomonas palustris]